jgi:hypothetical protein
MKMYRVTGYTPEEGNFFVSTHNESIARSEHSYYLGRQLDNDGTKDVKIIVTHL